MVGLRRILTMHLLDTAGAIVTFDFVVDSGATHSVIGLDDAILLGLPVPPTEVELALSLGTAQGSTPVRVRPGRVRGWWDASCRGYPFDWPVLFRADLPAGVPALLGLGGVIGTCDWRFSGGYSPDAPFSHLTLDDTR